MVRDDTPGAESEISSETIVLSEPETSESVSVQGETLTIHPEEDTTVEVGNTGGPSDQVVPNGFVTTRISPIVPFEETPEISNDRQSRMRYNEDLFLADALEYIKKTYGQHYANPEAQGFQLFDLWDSQGSLLTTARDTAQKYLTRFGKKDGFNKKDLYKAIHYIVLMNYANRNNE